MKSVSFFSLLAISVACSNPVTTKPNALYEFTSETVSFKSDTFNLNGTIDIPKNAGSKPAIVIIPGSGPVDKDGNALEKPIYKIWSNYLAQRGFIVLRFDKRFLTYKDLNYTNISESTQINDAESAIKYLKTRIDVDTSKLSMIGHSEGGSIVPAVSGKLKTLKSIIVISASAIPIDSLFIFQLQNNPANPSTLIDQAKQAFVILHNGTFPDNGQIFGGGKQYWIEFIQLTTKTDSIISSQPSRVLFIQGLSDENYPGNTLADNLSRWKSIGNKSNGRIQINEYADITHLLLKKTTRDTSEAILLDISNWLTK